MRHPLWKDLLQDIRRRLQLRRRHRLLLVSCACAAMSLPALAEPPTARYAPAQLRMAEIELEHAAAAKARGDLALAERFAAQAELDARLAWTMTNSVVLREEALELLRDAAALKPR